MLAITSGGMIALGGFLFVFTVIALVLVVLWMK